MCLNALVRGYSRRLHDWLSLADPPGSADLIFVLAGGMDRKSYGLELFRQGLAPRILFSVGRFEIRRFSKMPLPVPFDLLKRAQDVPPPERHFFVLFEDEKVSVQHVLPRRLGTLNEISALGRWLRDNPQVRSVLTISSGTHLCRLRLCCRFLLDPAVKVIFLGTPQPRSKSGTIEPREFAVPRDVLELTKFVLYACFLKLMSRPSR